MSEIHSSLRSSKRSASKRSSKLGRTMSLQKPPGDSLASSDLSDSEQLPNDLRRKSTVAYLQRAFATCKMANANKMPHVPDYFNDDEVPAGNFAPGQGSSYERSTGLNSNLFFLPFKADQPSYTVSRDNSTTDFLELAREFGSNFSIDRLDGAADSGVAATCTPVETMTSDTMTATMPGGHPGIGHVGALDNVIMTASPKRGHPGLGSLGPAILPTQTIPPAQQPQPEGYGIQTIGQLRAPTSGRPPPSANRAPLGSVPACHDSGLTSDNFSNFFESLGDRNMGDGMSGSDSQLDEFEPYKGLAAGVGPNTVAHKQMKLEEALVNLDPREVEKKRMEDFGGGGGDFVAGSIDDFFDKLPYGVRTPDSVMSTGSR